MAEAFEGVVVFSNKIVHKACLNEQEIGKLKMAQEKKLTLDGKGIFIITAGSEFWEPTPSELNALGQVFEEAVKEAVGNTDGWAFVVVRRGIDVGVHRIHASLDTEEGAAFLLKKIREATDLKLDNPESVDISTVRLE